MTWAYGPCTPYATAEDVQACGACSELDLTGGPTENDNPLLAKALQWASRRFFEATGGQWWGCCEITVRPCRPSQCWTPAWGPPPLGGVPVKPWLSLPATPYGTYGPDGETVFVNVWHGCGCGPVDTCGCGTVGARLELPYGPVGEVLEILVDVVELPAEGHWYQAGSTVIRTDDEQWPSCQRLGPPDDPGEPDAGTWSVRYQLANMPPPEVVPLIAAYACELAKACGGGECSLGPGIRVVQRDGVEFAVAEPSEYRELGLTGFGPLDDWITLQRGGHVRWDEAPRAYIARRPQELF